MNKGTKIRSILFAIACINQAIVSVGDIDFGSNTVNVAYKTVSTAFTIIVSAIALYYNNDFTVEGAIGTQKTRDLKEIRGIEQPNVEEPEDSEVRHDDK